jgi:hypothetical protein
MSRRGLGGPEKGLQSVMFHRQLLLTHAPSGEYKPRDRVVAFHCAAVIMPTGQPSKSTLTRDNVCAQSPYSA